MTYTIEPLPLRDGMKSQTVFMLCRDSKNPFETFRTECRDKVAVQKMAKAIESIDTVGIQASKEYKKLRHLQAGKSKDLYEIRTNGCTARAYTYFIDSQEVIVIAFIKPTTHSGTGHKDTEMAIQKLEDTRPAFEEAMRGWRQQ